MRGTVVTDPARPTRRRGAGRAARRARDVGRVPRRCRPRRRRSRPPSAGRCAGAARSSGRSRCPPTGPPARGRVAERRTRSSRRRCRPRGTGPAVATVRRPSVQRGRAQVGQLGLLDARDDLGVRPSVLAHHRLEVGAVGGVPRGAGGHHPHAVHAEVAGAAARTRRARSASVRSPRGRAGPSRRRPGRAAPPPCGAARRPHGRPAGHRRRAGGWSWCRSRSRRPGSRGLLAAAARRARPPTTRPAFDRLVADRVHAWAHGQCVRRPARAGT